MISRYLSNPARAKAYYVDGDKTAYEDESTTALVYGYLAHKMLETGQDAHGEIYDYIEGDPKSLKSRNDKENRRKIIYAYGKESKGVKKDFTSLNKSVGMARDIVSELNIFRGKKEVVAENQFFNGRADLITKDNILVDYKFIQAGVNFDKVWNDKQKAFTTWFESTAYKYQAYIYNQLFHPEKIVYVIVTKELEPDFRVYDLTTYVKNNIELKEEFETAIDMIEKINKGKLEAERVEDGSDWMKKTRKIEMEIL